MDDGQSQDEIILNNPSTGLYLPPRIWTVQHRYSTDAILLVLASEVYEANDYIREYSEYLAYIGSLEN